MWFGVSSASTVTIVAPAAACCAQLKIYSIFSTLIPSLSSLPFRPTKPTPCLICLATARVNAAEFGDSLITRSVSAIASSIAVGIVVSESASSANDVVVCLSSSCLNVRPILLGGGELYMIEEEEEEEVMFSAVKSMSRDGSERLVPEVPEQDKVELYLLSIEDIGRGDFNFEEGVKHCCT